MIGATYVDASSVRHRLNDHVRVFGNMARVRTSCGLEKWVPMDTRFIEGAPTCLTCLAGTEPSP